MHHATVLFTMYAIDPGPISELHSKVRTNASVNITWKPPKDPYGVIVAYFVEHGVYQDELTTSVELNVTGGSMYTVIQGLGEC